MQRYQRRLISIALAVLIAGVLVGRYALSSRTYAHVHHAATTNPIQHIVFILKENHTFDNYFGLFPGANGTATGKVKINGVVKTIPLAPAVDQPDNFCHGWNCEHDSYDNGQMDNFAAADASQQCTSPPYPCYSEAQPSLIPNYWALAQHFVLSDNTFSSEMSSSFANHLFSVSGASGSSTDTSVTDNPDGTNDWGCDAPSNTRVSLYNGSSVYPCFSYKTLADEMQAAGVSWKEYGATASDAGYKWDTLNAFSQDRNNATIWSHNVDWSQLASDAAAGNLPAFSWVTAPMADSEHPPYSTCAGENWTIQQIDAMENSPEWSSTVIILAWDDWGGFYDHVAPASKDALGYGFRVPLMVISPYAFAGDNPANPHITHDQFELESVLKLAEEVFHLPALTERDSSAGDLQSALDFSKVHNTPLILNTRACSAQTAPIKGDFDD